MKGPPCQPTVVLLARDRDAVARCLHALPADLNLLAGGTSDGLAALQELADGRFQWLDSDGAAAWNEAARGAATDDLLLLDARTELTASALERVLAAARRVPEAATITPLSNDAGYLSVPRRNIPWPLVAAGRTVSDTAQTVANGSLDLLPRIPTALPHATLVRRPALDLVGAFDERLDPRDALADFCMRAQSAGLPSILADAAFVAHRGDLGAEASHEWAGDAAAIHPALVPALREAAWDRGSALARSLLAVSTVLEPLRVTIDARGLAGGISGTTVQIAELIVALSAREDIALRALMPEQIDPDAAGILSRGKEFETLDAAAVAEAGRGHVAHRPWQPETLADLELLDLLGERTVVTHQDLIGYRTPQVFATPEDWIEHRRVTRDALALATLVLFISEAAMDDALADDLVSPGRSRVVPNGAGGTADASLVTSAPAALAGVEDRPMLVMIGRRYRHKNSVFALAMFDALRREHGWDGELVLAGPDVLHGSGSGDDAAWLVANPETAAHVHELGAVSQSEKAWLFSRAAAVVFPSTYEGFGLVPFEAAQVGVPCAFAPVSAVGEMFPADIAVIQPWDPAVSASRLMPLLHPGPARNAHLDALATAAKSVTWDRTAELAVSAYRDAVRLPPASAARLATDLTASQAAYWGIRDSLSTPAWKLIDPDAPLLDDETARRLVDYVEHGGDAGLRRLLRARGAVAKLSPRKRG